MTAPSIAMIQLTVAADYGVTLKALLSSRRDRTYVIPRHVAMWLSRRATSASLPRIGRMFGGRHHTSVMHAIGHVDGMMIRDREFSDHLNGMLAALREGDERLIERVPLPARVVAA